jgi:hypothetical protein
MFENVTPSRPINLFRRPTGKRSPAILDRLDAIQEEVELQERRRARDASAADRYRKCLRAICLDLLDAMQADQELCVGVRRDKSALTNNAAYPEFVSARQFLAALGGLLRAGYATQVSLGTEASGKTTRIKGTQKLHSALAICIEYPDEVIDTTDPIRLKVGKPHQTKKSIRYEDTPDTIQWRANLENINENNGRYALALDLTSVERATLEREREAKAREEAREERKPFEYERLNTARTRLFRVFNKPDWTEGGRFYGGWWQQVPRGSRKHITINGKATCEHDFSSLHLRLLYAKVGEPTPSIDDPYGKPYGVEHREAVKKAFNVIVNSSRKLRQASVPEFSSSQLHMTWQRFLDGITEHHKPISNYFYSGEGTRLQRADANIAERVMLKFVAMGYPCLPLHDSFITFATLDDELGQIMETAAVEEAAVIVPAKRKYVAQYSGPIGPVTDDIGTLLNGPEAKSWVLREKK